MRRKKKMPENCEGGCGDEVGYSECKYVECSLEYSHTYCKKCFNKLKKQGKFKNARK